MRRLFLLLFLFSVAAGCSESKEAGESSESCITFPDDTAPAPEFDPAGGTATIAFTAAERWTAAVEAARSDLWCEVYPTEGPAGAASISVVTQPNDSEEARTASIVLQSGATKITLTVSQDFEEAWITFEEDAEPDLTFGSEGGSKTVSFTTNRIWQATVDADETGEPVDWCSVSPDSGPAGSGSFTVTVQPNENDEPRSVGIRLQAGSIVRTLTTIIDVHVPNPNAIVDIPDEGFKAYMVGWYDSDGDGEISEEEAARIERIDVSGMSIQSLEGIEYCTALTELLCEYTQLTDLDVSGCTALQTLDCSYNLLTNLNVSGCMALQTLNCSYNRLTNLNVSGCTALTELWCRYNQLTNLDLSGCTALTKLRCDYNQLTNLDLGGYTALQTLNCSGNQWTNLNVSGCTVLTELSVEGQLANLNVSGCTALPRLYCYGNQLTNLNVSGCTALTWLNCSANQLTNLDVSGCTALQTLSCPNNQLTKLGINGCTALTELDCSGNQLTNLDISGCTALTYLTCGNNQLTNLGVSGCTALTWLYCSGNQLTNLNVSECAALQTLYCMDNQLTKLELSGCTSLRGLYCQNNWLCSEIPDWFNQLNDFTYDVRYLYETKEDGNGGFVTVYTDLGVGWWYSGEPERGYHTW